MKSQENLSRFYRPVTIIRRSDQRHVDFLREEQGIMGAEISFAERYLAKTVHAIGVDLTRGSAKMSYRTVSRNSRARQPSGQAVECPFCTKARSHQKNSKRVHNGAPNFSPSSSGRFHEYRIHVVPLGPYVRTLVQIGGVQSSPRFFTAR